MTVKKLFQTVVLVAAVSPMAFGAEDTGVESVNVEAHRIKVAQFGLDTGDFALALSQTSDIESEESHLIRARALLATGNRVEARALLDELVRGQYQRAPAALILASLAAQQGDSGRQRELLELAASRGNGETQDRALFELAELARQSGQPDKAGQLLAKVSPGYWAAMGYLNVAADYSSSDRDPSRALVALRVALAMADEDDLSERGESLKNRLLLRAGYLSFINGDFDKAISFLEKLPLDDFTSPQGLYLHGLALTEKNNHRGAMQSWHRAKKFPMAYPGVVDAWLGMGWGYDQTGYLGQAGEAYLAAGHAYETERATLRTLETEVREKGAYQALARAGEGADAQWFLDDNRTLNQPRSAYLLKMLEDPDAQMALDRVAELDGLRQRLEAHQNSISVFREAIQQRQTVRAEQAYDSVHQIDQNIKELARRAKNLAGSGSLSKEQVAAINEAISTLGQIKAGVQNFPGDFRNRAARFDALMARLVNADSAARKALTRAEALYARASSELDQKALAFIVKERQRMLVALDRAEQQIAHLYEYLAVQTARKGQSQ